MGLKIDTAAFVHLSNLFPGHKTLSANGAGNDVSDRCAVKLSEQGIDNCVEISEAVIESERDPPLSAVRRLTCQGRIEFVPTRGQVTVPFQVVQMSGKCVRPDSMVEEYWSFSTCHVAAKNELWVHTPIGSHEGSTLCH